MMLLVGHYDESNPERAAEYAECLRRNCEIPCIEQIHRFIETPTWKQAGHRKVNDHHHGQRICFDELFHYASRELAGHICIIANSDIFFDETLVQLCQYNFTNQLLAISRWNLGLDGKTTILMQWTEGTQDAWIFRAPIVPFACNWHLGIPECDRRIVYEARQAGLNVRNPCLSIKITHLHLTGLHTYDLAIVVQGPSGFVKGDTLYPDQSAIESPKRTFSYDPYHPIPMALLRLVREQR